MNNFEQKDEILAHLRQVAHNLMLIADHAENVTPLERDMFLQSLREAYMDVLQLNLDNSNVKSEKESVDTADAPIPTEEKKADILPPTPEPEPVVEAATPAETPATPEPAQPKPIEEPVAPEPQPEPEPEPEVVPPVPEEAMAGASALLNSSGDILDFLGSTMDAAWAMPEETETPEPAPAPQPEPTPQKPQAAPQKITTFPPFQQTPPIVPVTPAAPAAPVQPTQPAAPVSPQPTPQPKPAEQPATPVQESLFPNEPATPQPAPRKSLHDILAQQHEDNSLAAKYQHSHIDDISKAISINDKFSFIKELFKGKSEDFSRAIQKLNACQSADEAFAEIEMMKKYYLWDTSSATYLSLCDLVRRKFI